MTLVQVAGAEVDSNINLAPAPLHGKDYSYAQGLVDWDKELADGVQFALIRASEGVDIVDSQFAANRAGVVRLGIPHGFYHFCDLSGSAQAQAAFFVATQVGDETVEERPQVVQLRVGEIPAELAIEAGRGFEQPTEQDLSHLGHGDPLNPLVSRIPATGDQTVRLHRAEVVGEGRLPDPHRLGELPLILRLAELDVEEDQPDRQGAAGGGQGLVEGPAGEPGGAAEVEADRGRDGSRRGAHQHTTRHRYLTV